MHETKSSYKANGFRYLLLSVFDKQQEIMKNWGLIHWIETQMWKVRWTSWLHIKKLSSTNGEWRKWRQTQYLRVKFAKFEIVKCSTKAGGDNRIWSWFWKPGIMTHELEASEWALLNILNLWHIKILSQKGFSPTKSWHFICSRRQQTVLYSLREQWNRCPSQNFLPLPFMVTRTIIGNEL